jgi:hypothetical protein
MVLPWSPSGQPEAEKGLLFHWLLQPRRMKFLPGCRRSIPYKNALIFFSTAFLREHKTVSDLNGHVNNHGWGFFSK